MQELSTIHSPPKVMLTFDFEEWEGQGRIYEADLYSKTKRVVDLLAEPDLPATFFLDAETAVKYPDAVEPLVKGGFELALHSDRHFGTKSNSLSELDFGVQNADQQMARMRMGIRMIRQVFPSFQPKGFRSPGLRWNDDLYVALKELHFNYDSSQQDKFCFRPFLKNGVIVLPVNCGDYDSACYKTRAQFVLDVWKDNFLRACRHSSASGYTYYMILAHPSVCGRRKYIGMLKAIIPFMASRRAEFLTCSEFVEQMHSGCYTLQTNRL